jgi:hypothetical protein
MFDIKNYWEEMDNVNQAFSDFNNIIDKLVDAREQNLTLVNFFCFENCFKLEFHRVVGNAREYFIIYWLCI